MSNDLIYRKNRVNLVDKKLWMFYFLSSIFSLLYSFVYIMIGKGGFRFYLEEAVFGIFFGLVSFFAYTLYLFSFDGENTSISVTIYRMNMIPAIVLAMVFLGETVTVRRMLGIALCILGMLLFSLRLTGMNIQRKSILLSIVACLFCGWLSFLNKVATLRGFDPFYVIFWRFFTVSLISGIILLKVRPGKITAGDLKYPAMSGFMLMLGVFLGLLALSQGDVSLIMPIMQYSFVATALFSRIVYKEKLGKVKLIGIGCSVLALALIL
jgi:uncharacterized membrane protein